MPVAAGASIREPACAKLYARAIIAPRVLRSQAEPVRNISHVRTEPLKLTGQLVEHRAVIRVVRQPAALGEPASSTSSSSMAALIMGGCYPDLRPTDSASLDGKRIPHKMPARSVPLSVATSMRRRSATVRFMQALLILAPGYGCAAGLADTMETCRHESDLNLRVTACAEVIGLSRDRRVLLRAHNTKGLALCDLDRCADAIPDFDEVIRLNPLIAGYFDNRARALRAAGRFDEAIRSSDHALRMAPGYAFIYFGKALALEGEKRFDEALTVLDQASSVDPTNAGVWELRGKLFGEEGQFARAYAAYDRALELQPSRVNVLRTRAGTEESEGKIQAAITDLRRYPADGPNHNDVSTQIFRLSNLPNGMKVELTHNRQDVQSLAQSSSDQNKNLDCVSIASSSERLKCFDEKYKDFSSAATNASPAPPINEGPQITKAPPMETGNYAEYCKNQSTKRGVLDESLYKYCFRQQTDGNEKIASLLAKYPNYTWLKDVMEAEISAYTKRGMRNDDMIAFLMSQEIDAFLDFDYTSKQKDFNAMAAAQCKEEYYNKRPNWQMILYCYKEKIGAD